jgi:2-polyprenyl-6-hydroxyphenyl methylase/3-demethylubiquinone-9 3-methyltransferase
MSGDGAGRAHDPALEHGQDAGRFAFGENWLAFIATLTDLKIGRAEQSLRDLLGTDTLHGARFLDAGCGSGLFSLAASRLGAIVCSFDFDENSVRAAEALRARYAPTADWTITQGSVLDRTWLDSLGSFDVVYSWGVLHHTGDMWRALGNVADLVRPAGVLCVAIYNDQGLPSRIWKVAKRTYNALPSPLRFLVLWPAAVRLWGPTVVRDALRGDPLRTWRAHGTDDPRGMSPDVDLKDWVGGYPFEVATPARLTHFYARRGFSRTTLVARTGIGCNEFVFRRASERLANES